MRSICVRVWLPGVIALLAVLAPPASAQQADDTVAQARKLRMTGQPAAAADLLGEALVKHPGNERLLGMRGLCLLDAGRTEEAGALAATLSGYDGNEPRVHTFLGRLGLASGDLRAADSSFRRALALDAGLVEASIGLVQTALAAGQLGAAVDEAAHLETLVPEQGRRYGAQALVAQAQKLRDAGDEQLGRAIDKYRAAVAKQPEDRAILRQLVECLILGIRIDEARALLAERFADPAQRAELHYYSGRCFDVLTETDHAREEYAAALAANPAHVPTLLELARLALEDGRPEEARAQLVQAAALETPGARACLLLGLAEAALGHDDAAETSLREAVRLDAHNTKALYHLGRLLVRRGKQSEGEALLAQVGSAQPH